MIKRSRFPRGGYALLSAAALATLATLALLVAVSVAQETPAQGEHSPGSQSDLIFSLDSALVATVIQQTPQYTVSQVAYNWIEISGSGMPVSLSGDNWGSDPVSIFGGYYFPFYEGLYQDLRVSTNGYIYFGGDDQAGAAVPNIVGYPYPPNNFIAPFGTDLYFAPGVSQVYYEYLSSPEPHAVIEFVDVQWCCGLNDPHTFEIVLYPDGRILTQYRRIRYLSDRNAYVVAGIENADGSAGVAFYQDWFAENQALGNQMAVLYDPGDLLVGHLVLQPASQTWWDDPGQTNDFNVSVGNWSGFTRTFQVNYAHTVTSVVPGDWTVSLPTTLGPISPTEFSNLQATVNIPLGADWDDQARLDVTLVSTWPFPISGTVTMRYGVAQRDLSVAKTLYPADPPTAPPGPGGDFRYQITVTNDDYPGSARAGQARGVVLTDTLPGQAELLGFDPPGGVTLTPDGFVWDVGDLGAYGSASLLVYMRIPGGVSIGATIANTAETNMLASRERGPFDNNTDSYSFNVAVGQTAFDVYKDFPGANVVAPGQVATFNVWAANVGNVPANDVHLTDILPPEVTFYSTTWPTYTWSGPNEIDFDLGALRNGGWNGVGFEISVQVPETLPVGTRFTNTVQLEGESDQEEVEVYDSRGDVWVQKYPEESAPGVPVVPDPGGDYAFWINYGNAGFVSVYTVTLTDTLPSSYVTLLEASDASGVAPITTTPGLVIWNLPDLSPGEEDWVQVRVLIDEDTPDGAQLVNTAEISAAQGGNITPINDSSTVTLTLEAADLAVSKRVVPTGTLQVGDWVTYTIRFSNTGTFPAYGVRVEDVWPDQLSSTNWQTAGHPLELLVDDPPRLLWRALQPLGTDDWGLITITGRLDPAATWPPQLVLTNTAKIRSYQAEPPDGDPNVAVVTNTVWLASPYVLKTGPTLALPGELLTYTVEYGNLGLLPAEGVRLTDTLPANTTYVADTSGLTTTVGTGWVAWDAGTVPSDTAGLAFSLVVSVSPATPIGTGLYNTLVVTSATYDGDRTDNQSTWLSSVGYDLFNSYKLINGQSWAEVGWGLPVTYTVVLTNQGPYDAPAVQLWDPIPTNTAYIVGSLSAPSGGYGYDPVGDAITWTGTVSGDTAISVTFQVTVAPAGPLPRGTVIRNTAFISDGVRDLQPTVTATVAGPDLSPSFKTVNEPRPPSGGLITYTISLFNDGEVDASARLTDALPAEVLYAGGGWASSGSLGSGDPITWTGIVPIDGYVTITLPVVVMAGPGSSFTNTAIIADGTGVILERSVRVDTQAPDLDVPETYKTASRPAVFSGERVTYAVSIYNGGDAVAPLARMTDTIQGGYYLGGGGASAGNFDDSGAPTILWDGFLSPGASVLITIPVVISATPGSDVPNVAYIGDGYGNLISRTMYVHVNLPPDISNSSKAVDQSQARAGELLLYTLTVDNSGDVPTAFVVTDTLDSQLTFSGFLVTPTGAVETAGTISWTGTISGMSQAQLIFWAAIDRDALGTITNTAYFADASGGFYTSAVATLIREPALSAVKRVQPAGLVQADTLLVYTIVLSNVSEVRTQVNLTDTIPAHTAYQYGSAWVDPAYYNPPLYISPTLTWGDQVDPGETVTLIFQARVSAGVSEGVAITNVAWLKRSGGLPFSVSVISVIGQFDVYLPVVIKGD